MSRKAASGSEFWRRMSTRRALPGNGAPVAGGAELGILLQHQFGIEAGAVRIEAASAHHGVTGEAIPFDVTRHTTLQPLSRRLAVAEEELSVAVVIPRCPEQGAPSRDSRLIMTSLTELAGVMTISAGACARIGVGGVPREIAGRVVAAAPRAVRNVTGQALLPLMARSAAPHRRRGNRTVQRPFPARRVADRRPRDGDGTHPTTGASDREQPDDGGGTGAMAGQAALLGVAGAAARGGAPGQRAVPGLKITAGVRRRRLEEVRQCERAGVCLKGLNRGGLGSVHVTGGAEFASVAGGTALRHSGPASRPCCEGAVAGRRGEVGRLVRRRNRERSDSLSRECDGTSQRQVTGGTRRVGKSEMIATTLCVTGHTLPSIGCPHHHPGRTALSVTTTAAARRVAALPLQPGVARVIEAEI